MSRLTIFSNVLSAILLCGWPAAYASSAGPVEPSPSRTVTLDGLIREALERSPAIQAKRRAYEAAKARVFAEWLPNDPEFGVDVEGQSHLFHLRSRTDNEFMLSQTIPFPTTLWLRGRLAAREAQTAFWQYKAQERDVAWHLEQPYYELLMATQTLKALGEVADLLDRLAAAVQARYEANQAAQQDVLKVQLERSRNELEVFEWRQKVHLAQAHLAHILDEPLMTHYTIAEESPAPPLTLSFDELEQLALHRRPELRALEVGIQRAKIQRTLAATRWLPDVTGRVEARQFPGSSRSHEYDTFIGVTVPVWSLVKGLGGQWRGAQREVDEAEATYRQMKNEVLLAIYEAYSKVTVADHAIGVYNQLILPQARQQVTVALSSYEAGRTEFLSLIDAQRMLRDAQIASYKVRADRAMGLSDLRLAIGSDWMAHTTPSATGRSIR